MREAEVEPGPLKAKIYEKQVAVNVQKIRFHFYRGIHA